MNDSVVQVLFNTAKSLNQPVNQLNMVMVNSIEKLAQFQMQRIKTYSDMGFDRLRKASEIHGIDDAREFTSQQVELMTELRHKLMDDSRALMDLGNEVKADMETVVSELQLTKISSIVNSEAAANESEEKVVEATVEAKPAAKAPTRRRTTKAAPKKTEAEAEAAESPAKSA